VVKNNKRLAEKNNTWRRQRTFPAGFQQRFLSLLSAVGRERSRRSPSSGLAFFRYTGFRLQNFWMRSYMKLGAQERRETCKQAEEKIQVGMAPDRNLHLTATATPHRTVITDHPATTGVEFHGMAVNDRHFTRRLVDVHLLAHRQLALSRE
jgi:hypothetical protein